MNQAHPRYATTTGGIICTSDYRASLSGIQMLDRGGNCIDAAIAAAAVLNVVEPYNSHLGGDAFMLYWSAADNKVTALNGSGAAPATAQLEYFTDGIPVRGIRAATVPGQVHAWLTAHGRWGKTPLATVLEPAVALAQDGCEVSATLANALAQATDCYEMAGFRQQFLPDGRLPAVGQLIRQPNIARALKLLAQDGIDAYYHGPIAKALVELSRKLGNWFEPQDLAAHRTSVEQPIAYDYRDWRVLEQPSPSQGIIVLQCLALARELSIQHLAFDDPDRVHLMIEILKACYADRLRWWADPRFTELPIRRMLSDDYLADRARLIDRDHARQYEAGDLAAGRDTTYFAVADADGNALSYIQSIFHGFGCGVVEPTYGVLLNNRMNGFCLAKGHPNALHPGKRPVHTLNTYMVLKDRAPVLVGGTPGGPSQVQWNFQVLSDILDLGMSVDRAAAAPRWAWSDRLQVAIESDFGDALLSSLRRRGHVLQITPPLGVGGRVQLIHLDSQKGIRTGARDPRVTGAVLTSQRPLS
jgi:gamma-glutamyltranspeptidase/glutathione hydrolase